MNLLREPRRDRRRTVAAGWLVAAALLAAACETAPPSRFRTFPAYYPVASLDKAFIQFGSFTAPMASSASPREGLRPVASRSNTT